MSLIDPGPGATYRPRGAAIYKCPQLSCDVEGTYEQVQQHYREVHLGLPPKGKEACPCCKK